MFTLIPTSVVKAMTKKKLVNISKYHSSDDEDEITEDDKKRRAEG